MRSVFAVWLGWGRGRSSQYFFPPTDRWLELAPMNICGTQIAFVSGIYSGGRVNDIRKVSLSLFFVHVLIGH